MKLLDLSQNTPNVLYATRRRSVVYLGSICPQSDVQRQKISHIFKLKGISKKSKSRVSK